VTITERAYATMLERYRLPNGALVYANSSPPLVSATVAGGIQAIVGLSDLARSHPEGLARLNARGALGLGAPSGGSGATGGPQPCGAVRSAASAQGGYTADRLASAYRFSGLYAAGDLGAGETVAVYELEPDAPTDIAAYQACYKTSAKVSYIKVEAGSGSGAGTGEAALDIENVIGLAPKAAIDVYQAPNNTTGPLDLYDAIVTQDLAEVITTSWGICEAQDGGRAFASAEANLFEEAAAQGQTVVAASGDDGSTDCTDASNNPIRTLAVDDPGSQPYVTSVGGTTLRALGPPPTETVWNDRSGASGGGISSNWAMPVYQSQVAPDVHVIKAYSSPKPCGAPAGDYCREVPDVSADANPGTGYLIFYGGAWTLIGGTSGAAPLWAALVALADAWPACSAHPVGFLNPSLYSIAGATNAAAAINDVTRGSNDLFGTGHYPATVGYDFASGLGTPDAANPVGHGLVAQLCTLPESGGVPYASPTKSLVTASRLSVKADGSAFSTVTVTLRSAAGTPVAGKRVVLVGTGKTTVIRPASAITNAKGIANFEVRDTVIQKVIYRATDLTDGVLLPASVVVSFVKP